MTRKIINLIIAVLFVPSVLLAQGRIADIWTQPAIFMADEPISIFFDVSGTVLDGISEDEGVCVWTWFPADPGDPWGSPTDKTKLKHVEGNVWRLDMTPTDFYNKPANEISAFYGQLQNWAGTKITDAFAPDQDPPNDIQVYSLAGIKGEELIEYFPKQFTTDRPLSVLINANNLYPDDCTNDPVPGQLAEAPNVHVHGGVNDWSIVVENNAANLTKTEMTAMGDGIYRWDLVPQEYFDLPEDYVLTNISAVFASSDWAYIGKNVNCTDFFIDAPEIPDIPIPDLVFFPSKFSQKDILIITRADNEPGVTGMNYTITAGSKTLTGSFEGNNKKLTAFINLADELKSESGLESIHIELKDNNNRIVSKNDIPLVQINQ